MRMCRSRRNTEKMVGKEEEGEGNEKLATKKGILNRTQIKPNMTSESGVQLLSLIDVIFTRHVSIQFLSGRTVTGRREFIVVVASEEEKEEEGEGQRVRFKTRSSWCHELAESVSETCSVTLNSVSVTHRAHTSTMSALSPPSTRRQTGVFNPSTPRNSKISYTISTPPSATPSISSSTPFDWDAARLRKPPPYGTPFVDRRLQALRNGGGPTPSKSTPTKRIVRKKTIWQK